MQIVERSRGDRRKLARMIAIEKDAQQRDRLRAVALALDGRETLAIVEQLGRSRAFVQRWAYAYRDGGIGAIRARTAPGRRPFLTPSQERALIDRLVAATKPGANTAALRARDGIGERAGEKSSVATWRRRTRCPVLGRFPDPEIPLKLQNRIMPSGRG